MPASKCHAGMALNAAELESVLKAQQQFCHAKKLGALTDNAIQLARKRDTSLSEVYRVCLEVL